MILALWLFVILMLIGSAFGRTLIRTIVCAVAMTMMVIVGGLFLIGFLS
jgi:hypothetical protein